VEYYLFALGIIKTPFICLVYFCILSNFVEPLITILFKKRTYRNLFHLPMMIWYAWSVLPTYVIGNIKGIFGYELVWFRTPKFNRSDNTEISLRLPAGIHKINLFASILLFCFYFAEGWFFGWFDEFALLLLPAFLLVSTKKL
jgi:hypothetical protein